MVVSRKDFYNYVDSTNDGIMGTYAGDTRFANSSEVALVLNVDIPVNGTSIIPVKMVSNRNSTIKEASLSMVVNFSSVCNYVSYNPSLNWFSVEVNVPDEHTKD